FKGYTAEFSPSVLKVLKKDPDVAYIEPDATVSIYAITTQLDAPWGLHRISHKNPITNFTNYVYDSSGGQDTYVYVLDTGVYADHREFEGRATYGANFAERSEPDGNGHGTHVAAIIGSRLYGVAKKTNIIGVKILNTYGMGRQSWVLQGLAWAVNDARDKKRLGSSFANMSLGGPYSEAVNSAVAAVVRAGLFMGVAAGNDGRPASRFSPASEPLACTVGATDIDDSRATYSNYGHSVDIFAPGTDILSAGIRSGFDNDVLSGTSMAVPHVVGLAAYLRALEGQERTPTEWCERLRELALRGVVS
ncbi:peptidase S8/S53 domain-containing protein, partial [Bisporella sp. PMI_857]